MSGKKKRKGPGRPPKRGALADHLSISAPPKLGAAWRKTAKKMEKRISVLSCEAMVEYLEKRGINPDTGEEQHGS